LKITIGEKKQQKNSKNQNIKNVDIYSSREVCREVRASILWGENEGGKEDKDSESNHGDDGNDDRLQDDCHHPDEQSDLPGILKEQLDEGDTAEQHEPAADAEVKDGIVMDQAQEDGDKNTNQDLEDANNAKCMTLRVLELEQAVGEVQGGTEQVMDDNQDKQQPEYEKEDGGGEQVGHG
jgi:hypothetical protein